MGCLSPLCVCLYVCASNSRFLCLPCAGVPDMHRHTWLLGSLPFNYTSHSYEYREPQVTMRPAASVSAKVSLTGSQVLCSQVPAVSLCGRRWMGCLRPPPIYFGCFETESQSVVLACLELVKNPPVSQVLRFQMGTTTLTWVEVVSLRRSPVPLLITPPSCPTHPLNPIFITLRPGS